ncbi:MAG: M48 family metallopeptidase [Burkholderiales bacterium]|jgi:STE24 endopeptidase|nr:M48 family metallopeptidase [Burkholderiales bacterium]
MTFSWFTLIFLAVISLTLMLRYWLSFRQVRFVAAHRETVPAAFAERISLEAHQKAADYTTAKQSLMRLEIAVDTVILLVWTLGGGLALLMRVTSTLPALWNDVVLIVLVSLIGSVLTLPISYYATFGVETRFGFNRATRLLWATDLIKGVLIGLVIGVPLLALLLWLMRTAGVYWWIWAWAVWMAFQLIMLVLYPTIIAPLFNKFKPLPEGETRNRIENLLQRCGFTANGLFVMDGSRRSGHGNAYFTGMGKTKRVVFYDTLLERLNDDEIEAVLAHELGHFKRHHIKKRIVFSAFLSLAIFALLAWLMKQTWFFTGLGIPTAVLPEALARSGVVLSLFLLVLPTFAFLLTPLSAAYSRRHEFEADAFAAAQALPESLINALVRLYEDNASTLTPDPVHSSFYDSHPPAAVRIAHLQRLKT